MKRRMLPVLLLGLALAFGAALVRGERPDRIRDAHARHAQESVPCETCHKAAESNAGTDDLLPAMDVCAGCHDITDTQKCGTCHTNPTAPASMPRTTVAQKFSHKQHLGQGTDCMVCHAGPERGVPRAADKAVCRRCHETASGRTDCDFCHAASEPRRPASHTDQWLSLHATEARVDQPRCAVCHTQTDCQECHAGDNVRPRVHPLNYEFNHALDARGGEATCSSCHEDAQFCQACHLARFVMPENHSLADWAIRPNGGRHAEEAQFDLESCVACHDAGKASPVCVECHGR